MPPSRAAPRSPSGDAGVSPPEQPEQPTEPITTSTAQIRIAVPPDAGARSKDLASAGVHRLGWPGSARWAHLTHPGRLSPCSWPPSSRRWAASRKHPGCPPRRRGFPRRAPSPTAVTTQWPASSGSAARWTRCTSGPTTSWTWTRPRPPPPRRTSRPFSSGRPPPRDARAIATARRTPPPTSTTPHRSGTASAGPSTTPTPARSTSAPRRRRRSQESGGETGWSRSVGRRSRRWGRRRCPRRSLRPRGRARCSSRLSTPPGGPAPSPSTPSPSSTPASSPPASSTGPGQGGLRGLHLAARRSGRRMASAIRRFSAAGVSDLVLDVRYNPGGIAPVVAAFGTLIAGDHVGSNVFAFFTPNPRTQQALLAAGQPRRGGRLLSGRHGHAHPLAAPTLRSHHRDHLLCGREPDQRAPAVHRGAADRHDDLREALRVRPAGELRDHLRPHRRTRIERPAPGRLRRRPATRLRGRG